MDYSFGELDGRSVKLIPLQAHHVDALFASGNHSEIWKYMSKNVTSIEDMSTFVEDALVAKASGSQFPYVIIDKASGTVIGSTRYLDISLANRHLEIGFTWLTPSMWRSSVNTECKYLLLRNAFETLHMVRVQLKTDERNKRSQRAIERIGGVREGTLRQHMIVQQGHMRDSVYFSILDEEWPQVKARLQAKMAP